MMKITHRAYGTAVAVISVLVLAPALAVAQSKTLANPLSSDFDSIPKFIAGALRLVVVVGLPIISLLIVYAGFLFLLARGNPEQLNAAKRNLLYVIIGSILLLGAWVIATLIGGTVSQLTNG